MLAPILLKRFTGTRPQTTAAAIEEVAMSADNFLRLAAQLLLVFVFVSVARRYTASRRRGDRNAVIFFGLFFVFIVHYWWVEISGADLHSPSSRLFLAALAALPLALLLLAHDYHRVPAVAFTFAIAGWVTSTALLASFDPVPDIGSLVIVVFFFGSGSYAAGLFWQLRKQAAGVTQRRLTAVVVGTLLLAAVVLITAIAAALPQTQPWSGLAAHSLGVCTALAYFLGFAPPAFIRRSWQEPEVMEYLAESSAIITAPDDTAAIRLIERAVGRALGSANAALGFANLDRGTMWALEADDATVRYEISLADNPSGEVVLSQRAMAWEGMPKVNPRLAELYRSFGVETMLCAPVTFETRRVGALVAYSRSRSVFADEDLQLLERLAAHTAVLWAARELTKKQADALAREATNRAKEDFLAAAAHDLRSPLTAILLHAQLLERQALAAPAGKHDLDSVRDIQREAIRLSTLVDDLLDSSRTNSRSSGREVCDLVEIVKGGGERIPEVWNRCLVNAEGPVMGAFDRLRTAQLLDNLVQNAAKYSPPDSPIEVSVWREDSKARLRVKDYGIGIPQADVPQLFERFRRASNAPAGVPGMGLGLYICRTVAEEHGGRIWVAGGSEPGTAIEVELAL
jgi:signal transduction histidine kinase